MRRFAFAAARPGALWSTVGWTYLPVTNRSSHQRPRTVGRGWEEDIMKLLRVIGASGLLLWSASMARAEVSPNPETSGAVTTPSGTETTTPPPATYDPGTPAAAPATEPATPPPSTSQDMAVPE